LSENGPIPDPDQLFTEGAAWSWFSTWSGSFITDGIVNTEAHIVKVFNHDYVITLDEIDQIDEIMVTLEERKAGGEPVTGAQIEDIQKVSFNNPIADDRLVLSGIGYPTRAVIYNIQGKIEFSGVNTSEGEDLEFDFHQKSSGMYFLKLITRRSVKVYRIIKVGN
jgi:hypothetical protein